MSILAPEAGGKGLELLRQAVPRVARMATLWNAADPAKAAELTDTQTAAQALKVTLQPVCCCGRIR